MSVTDALVDLEALLNDLPTAIDNRRLGDTLSGSLAKLRDADYQIDRIEALLEIADVIRFGEAQSQTEMVEEVRDAAHETGNTLVEAETALALESAVYSYEHNVKRSISSLDRSLGQHWRTLAQRQFEPMIAIGNLLSRIEADSDLGASLAAFGNRACITPSGLGGRALLDHVRQLDAERERLQRRRREELGEGDIALFVNALAEDRATLAMLTTAVRQWLDENHALEKLKVRPA